MPLYEFKVVKSSESVSEACRGVSDLPSYFFWRKQDGIKC